MTKVVVIAWTMFQICDGVMFYLPLLIFWERCPALREWEHLGEAICGDKGSWLRRAARGARAAPHHSRQLDDSENYFRQGLLLESEAPGYNARH